MSILKTFAALPATAPGLAMILAPMLAPLPALAQAPPAPAAQFCPNNRVTNGNFALTTGSPDAVLDQDINVATGWEPLWQTSPQNYTSLADLFGPTIGVEGAIPAPASGNYAGMIIANGIVSHPIFREGMLNRLTARIPANSGIYSFTFRTAALSPAPAATGVPSIVGIYGVYRAPTSTTLPLTPTGLNNPANLDLFGPGNAVLLGQIQVPANAGAGWQSHMISVDSANFGSLANISHIMVTKADGFPSSMRYVAFDDFCMQAAINTAPPFNPCCPPWSVSRLSTMLSMQRTGSAATPYRIRFAPTADLHRQMNAYIAYLQSLNIGLTQMGIVFQLNRAGTGAAPIASGVTLANVPIHWTGTGAPVTDFFNPGLEANHWYQIRTFIFPSGGPSGFAPAECSGGFIYVRWQPLVGGAAEVLLRYGDGRTEERIIVP
jgi:hypothetical protein